MPSSKSRIAVAIAKLTGEFHFLNPSLPLRLELLLAERERKVARQRIKFWGAGRRRPEPPRILKAKKQLRDIENRIRVLRNEKYTLKIFEAYVRCAHECRNPLPTLRQLEQSTGESLSTWRRRLVDLTFVMKAILYTVKKLGERDDIAQELMKIPEYLRKRIGKRRRPELSHYRPEQPTGFGDDRKRICIDLSGSDDITNRKTPRRKPDWWPR